MISLPSRLSLAPLYLRTLRHLQWRQLAYRSLRRVQRSLPWQGPRDAAPPWSRAAALAAAVASWQPQRGPAVAEAASAVLDGTFRFLHRIEHLEPVDWTARYVSRLWTYNLHYFDYAVDMAWAHRHTGDGRFARGFERLASGWIAGTRDRHGDGWDPYPLSVRAINWAHALLLFGDALGSAARAEVAQSLYQQLAYLERRLEWDVLGNHLQRNLCALLVGGLLFEGSRAARWKRRGVALLRQQVEEQVLPDGGHFERAPMYHAIALGDLLMAADLLRAVGEPFPAATAEHIARMTQALGALTRPNGELHLLNDSGNGIAPPLAWLRGLAGRVLSASMDPPSGAWSLAATGYFGYRDGGEALIVDCGDPSPPYQPGHAHCGILSFELDLAGRPFVVDSGVHGYDGDPYREYVRSTRAHNTVAIAGKEQSEVWGTFRMARRAEVVGERVGAMAEDGRYVFHGAYRPYHDRRAIHRRTIEHHASLTVVTDRVEGAPGAVLTSHLHIHPDFTVTADAHRVIASATDRAVTIEVFGCDAVRVVRGAQDPVQGWYCPEFGRALPAAVLEMRVHANHGREFGFRLVPVR